MNATINHTHFAALKVKDAIVDQMRDRYGVRPNIALSQPDVRIHVHVHDDIATISLDLAGDSLHKRGYREQHAEAPIKENLAAALLEHTDWLKMARAGGTLLDPLCGSGTLLIEAALMATDTAPGLRRQYFGFLHWQQHDAKLWQRLVNEAVQRRTQGLKNLPTLIGYDHDAHAITVATLNVERAGLHGRVILERRALAELTAPSGSGLMVTNPPYGERLGDSDELRQLYRLLGDKLKTDFPRWQVAVLTANSELGKAIGIRAHTLHTVYNGALACQLLHFTVTPEWFMREQTVSDNFILSSGAHILANRLRKNLKQLRKWAHRENITCFRLYDADLPEYAMAIDIYEKWVHLQEYAPPATVDAKKAQLRLQEAIQVVAEVLALPKESIFLKTRQPQKDGAQYRQLNTTEQFYEVSEGQAQFSVNLTNYLDTGLFLDQRLIRQLLQKHARGQRFLNLFGYTGTATVQAALGGATATVTVDASKTYLEWARRNFVRNGLTDFRQHQLIAADCIEWLKQQRHPHYGLIFLDSPTFSNSKDRHVTLDVQRDHPLLIRQALHCLQPQGVLLFVTHHQRFSMDTAALTGVNIENISHLTLPKDFARSPRIHQCWKITHLERK